MADAEIRELRARIESLERSNRLQSQQAAGPDLFADPQGWADALRASFMQEVRALLANASFANAAEEYGERFQEALKAVTALDPQNHVHQRIRNSVNPGREIIRWHDEQRVLSEHMKDWS